MMQLPAKVNPELARVEFKQDYDLIINENYLSIYKWNLEPDFDNLILYADLWSFDNNESQLDDYHVMLDMSYYRTWPPGVTYINPTTKSFDQQKDLKWFPKMVSKPPGMDIGYHLAYALLNGKTKQMICNSMVLEYYLSNHNPSDAHKWNPLTHNFATTLHVLQIMLRQPYYGGRSA